jgi:hypothetical protein
MREAAARGTDAGTPVHLLRNHSPTRRITAMLGLRWLVFGFYAVVYLCKQIKPAMNAFPAAGSATKTTVRKPDDTIDLSIISLLLLLWRKVLRKNQG